MKKVTDIHITSKTLLPTPLALCQEIDKTQTADKFVSESREAIKNIIFGSDHRLLVVIGPLFHLWPSLLPIVALASYGGRKPGDPLEIDSLGRLGSSKSVVI